MESDDSEGEELELIRPGFIHDLQNVLREYSDDGQILKEMIQNSEDAGATTVQIMADIREFHQQFDARTLKKHPHLKYFKGPALRVYNDAYFTEDDWKGIRMLHKSTKEKDPMKVGRFGLGFKSVFHLTDRLVILSGDRIMYMDPFKGEDRFCNSKRLSGLKGTELHSIRKALEESFDVWMVSGKFQGTLFWFPLRSEPSELSTTVYTERNMEDLFNSFRAEARSMMLFLKNIEKIQLFRKCNDRPASEMFQVAVHSSCLLQVRAERKAFIDRLKEANGTLPQKNIISQIDLVIEIADQKFTFDNERWIVVNFHPGVGDVSPELSTLCTDPNLSYQPFVGVALPVSGQHNFQSHLFCFLPLPLDTKSPTGLPVHVNGFFALSQNRRNIKWPTADQLRFKTHLEPAVRWNCLLVDELLPRAYSRLLERLKELYIRQPDDFYNSWPDIDAVADKWKPLTVALYREIIQKDFLYTQARGGSWIHLTSAVFYSVPEHLESTIAQTVVKVCNLSHENLVRLPRHIEETLRQLEFLTDRYLNPARVSNLARNCLMQLNSAEKLNLLQYLLSFHNPSQLLVNLQLLPLQSGKFGTFQRSFASSSKIYWCQERLVKILPGLEDMICSISLPRKIGKELHTIAQAGQLNVQELQESSEDLPWLLEHSLQIRFGNSNPILSANNTWIEEVWNLLSTSHPWLYDLGGLHKTALLPEISKDRISLLPLHGIYVCGSVSGMLPLPNTLMTCLSKLEIKLLSGLPPYATSHNQVLGHLVQYPSAEGILSALRKVCDEGQSFTAIQRFNSSATKDEREALVTLLYNATDSLRGAQHLLRSLKLFTEAVTMSSVSLEEVNVIGPLNLPHVRLPRRYLECSWVSRHVALHLGASEETLQNIIENTLKLLQHNTNTVDITAFMKYFLENDLATEQNMYLARKTKFLRMPSGQLKCAEEVYDPSSYILQELFEKEEKFPSKDFLQPHILANLRKIGLRNESNVTDDDLIATAQKIENYSFTEETSLALRKAKALWKMLVTHGHSLKERTLNTISTLHCMPCLQEDQRPADYPKTMPLMSQPAVVKPSQMCDTKWLRLLGSVMPVMPSGMPEEISKLLGVNVHVRVGQVNVDKIFQHLRETVNHFRSEHASEYRLIFREIFEFLLNSRSNSHVIQILKEEPCVLIESEDCFVTPNKLWIQRKEEDIDLRPYGFLLSREMSTFQDLFVICGSHLYQDSNLLLKVLSEIQDKHQLKSISHQECALDLRLVNQILDVLSGKPEVEKGNVIIPIWQKDPNILRFQQVKDCMVGNVLDRLSDHGQEEIYYVHQGVPDSTALKLGALNVKDRLIKEMHELDSEYGQHEDLIDRIDSLLKDSYTDGFSVPKELIQNADDAGATEFRFLLDDRENNDARTNLITEQMASLQGPAMWAFNNAMFSADDVKNIIRLGGGTKKGDATKVGKFGLGFNSVYNLTDVPCYISGRIMAMFDPQVKYLKGTGLKLDFENAFHRDALRRMPNMFKPFEGVFGCKLNKEEDGVKFNGTLFRFPWRTPEQAKTCLLEVEPYTEEKQKEFLKMLLNRAGSLLMFTQHIKTICIFHIPGNCDDPSRALCLLRVTKISNRILLNPTSGLGEETILKFCAKQWPGDTDIKIMENVEIKMDSTTMSADACNVDNITNWRVAWASGTDQTAEIARKYKHKRLIPLAAAAALMQDGRIVSIENSPSGFYTSGHLFCFLPLPEEMVHLALPVHLNGTFALDSSRRGLPVKTEDDLSSLDADWNSALFADAVCRAYLLLLETILIEMFEQNDFNEYFALWPTLETDWNITVNFYKRVVLDSNRVFPTSKSRKCVSFHDAWFLDPNFRFSSCGDIVLEVLNRFWKEGERIVDLPENIGRHILTSDQKPAFESRLITQVYFFKEIFFPHIKDKLLTKSERDKLVQYALLQKESAIQDLVRNCACIPCAGSDVLQEPVNLIHPRGLAASLFLTADGLFPQDAETLKAANEDAADFCSEDCLNCLVNLDMITDHLPEPLMLDRAQSITTLIINNTDQAIDRAIKLIQYLASPVDTKVRLSLYSPAALDVLSKVKFFPVQPKPPKWIFPWGGDGKEKLAAPNELFSENLKHLVACNAKILDQNPKVAKGRISIRTDIFRKLGLKTEESNSDVIMIHLAIKQLLTIANSQQKDIQIGRELVQKICSELYSFLDKCCGAKMSKSGIISEAISGKKIVWTGNDFVIPSDVAFECMFDCRPHLFKIENPLKQHSCLCEIIGVKKEFNMEDILVVIDKIYNEHKGRQLPKNAIQLVSRVAQLLCETLKKCHSNNPLQGKTVYLPDRQRYLQSVDNLCFDDCIWLKETKTMKFIHESIPSETAKMLGVESKRTMDYNSMTDRLAFGQTEKLTTRIKRLLQGYTCDLSIFKELIQNADDAGATEIKFIKDFRRLNAERVPPFQWELLQGPALCVYNNKSFTSDDMKGIQNLGEGNKSSNILKTGKYGVGFNAVYQLTDVPSFWTRENDNEEVVCVFDPNCKYVLHSTPDYPGRKFTDINRLKREYSDMFAGYLGEAIDMTKPGTLFRLPLRTEEMAQNSELKTDIITTERISKILDHFSTEVSICFLFLNNLRKIGIYRVNGDGTLVLEYEVTMTIDETCLKEQKKFNNQLQLVAREIKDKSISLDNIARCEVVLRITLKDSKSQEEEWLVVNRIGLNGTTNVSDNLRKEWNKEHFQLLPRGGVAVKVAETSGKNTKLHSETKYFAFCILPLPVETNLPVQINGHFALDHEIRRNLWLNKDDARTEWNEKIVSEVIVPAYITAILKAKESWFGTAKPIRGKQDLYQRLKKYHDLFPDIDKAPLTFWKNMRRDLYKQIAKEEVRLFPVVDEQCRCEWVPVVKKQGCPGYFHNLVSFFKSNPFPPDNLIFVPDNHFPYDSVPRKTAKKMKSLLKDLNMKVIESPFHIFENFKTSDVGDVCYVTPESVIHFLMTAGTGNADECNLTDLPKLVKNTSLQTVANVKQLVWFLQHDRSFLNKLKGLPLSLRQSENLYLFESTSSYDQPIVSKFCNLLPCSAEAFLHQELYAFFEHCSDTALLKRFDIATFAFLLPHTLPEIEFKTSQLILLDPRKLPSPDWLELLWSFLQSQLESPVECENETEVRNKIETALSCLSEWSLIPAKQSDENRKEQTVLYPIKDMQNVVFLHKTVDPSNRRLWDILRSLPLAFLDITQLPQECVITRIVASMSHPSALLNAITSVRQHVQLFREDAFEILSYFKNCMRVLRQCYASDETLKRDLEKLPLYSFLDGTIAAIECVSETLFLAKDIPCDGLISWSRTRLRRLALLCNKSVPEEISRFLCFKSPKAAEFYSDYLLPTLNDLNKDAIKSHIKYLIDHFHLFSTLEQDILANELKNTAFVEKNGFLYRASEFYSNNEPVFEVMCQKESFPPEPWNNKEWSWFMITAGIIHKVTNTLFNRFALELQRERLNVTENVILKSSTLVHHLFQMENETLLQSKLLHEIRDIHFIQPSLWQRSGHSLSAIVPPFCLEGLVSFRESCLEKHLHLVWSSSAILHPEADPIQHFRDDHRQEALKQLGFSENVPKDKVFRHIKNVCVSLAGNGTHKHFGQLNVDVPTLKTIMTDIYEYLSTNTSEDEHRDLKQLPIICDTDKMQMLFSETVVLDLRDEEAIEGYINRAPISFGAFFPFFEKLGAARRVTANHYANVLLRLKAQVGNNELHIEEMKVAIKAVEGLFLCLKSDIEEVKTLTVQDLFLPAKDNCLWKSSELIYEDDPSLKLRVHDHPCGNRFFIGFTDLKIQLSSPLDCVARLPCNHKMIFLSKIAVEIIPESIKTTSTETETSKTFSRFIADPLRGRLIVRLYYHLHHKKEMQFTEETEKQITERLQLISVREVYNLQTILMINSNEVEGSQKKKIAFTDVCNENPRMCTIYLDSDACKDMAKNIDTFLRCLAVAVEFVVNLMELERYLLHTILKTPEEALTVMDSEGIIPYTMGIVTEQSIFPTPGAYIPVSQHCFLDNSFYNFYVGEHIGFEVYDPQLDGGDLDEIDSVFIYAVVLDELTEENSSLHTLFKTYQVNLGLDRGTAKVSVTKLYKFIRKAQQNAEACKALEEFAGQYGTQEEDVHPADLAAVLKDIRRMLIDAWELSDEKDRMRVVKRLYLRWHPDKNRGNEEFCTRVVQALQRYTEILKNGRKLKVDEDEVVENFETYGFQSSSSSFFENMRRRGERYRSFFEDERNGPRYDRSRPTGATDGNPSEPNPQPGEGGRWLRQAKADLVAAQEANQKCSEGKNWICFQCHQASENALKAILYHRGTVRDVEYSHVLLTLATLASDETLQDLAYELQKLVVSYAHLRYPDNQGSPIPADYYTAEHAFQACELASGILKRTQQLIARHD